jgi:citrate lyase beta subunit
MSDFRTRVKRLPPRAARMCRAGRSRGVHHVRRTSDVYGSPTATDLAHLCSLLFAPGSDERKLRSALALSADGAVADLEDAVAPAQKEAAREIVARVRPPIVRVNGAETQWFAADLALVEQLAVEAIVLPKAMPEAVAALGDTGPPVIAIVETAAGVRNAYEIAAMPRVAALLLGAVDLGAEVGLEPRPDGLEILYARSKVVLDSAAAGIRPPFDIVHLDVTDDEGLEEECRLARSLGFRGKACIHPAQVPIVNRVFAPSEAEVDWARRVVEAYEREAAEGRGVFALNGAMVDLPVVERARRVLTEAERS